MNWLDTETTSLWNLNLALAACCLLLGCSRSHTEKVTLPGGEIVINKSTPAEWRSAAHNKIFFQRNSSSPREEVGDAWALEDNTIISLRPHPPQIFIDGDHVTLVVGSHVFQRIPGKQSVHWSHKPTSADEIASLFIRSLLPTNSPLLRYTGSVTAQKPTSINPFYAPYVFHQFDPKENVLTTRCAASDPTLPQFLVYSAVKYGSPWSFDLERTRKANNLNPPQDSDILIDFSVITYPGQMQGRFGRSDCLEVPGAKEIYAQTLPLSYTSPIQYEYSLTKSTGSEVQEREDVLLGFRDPANNYLTVSRLNKRSLMPTWDCVRIDVWILADDNGFDGNLNRAVFFRLRVAPP